ncbi:MAG: RNA polymerase sigma factor [Ardenticatenales bacterium]|nr:RNA polymerase sigma factor [Ardenticatenales bacterium]
MATHSLLQDAQAISPRRSAARDAADHPTAGRDTDGAADSDESLVRRAQSGDRDAIVAVYRRYVNEIFGYAYHQLGNAQDAEDVTSETFLRLVSALDGFDHRASFRTWLYTVARNQLRDRWRQRGRQPAITDWDEADNADRSVAADDARRSDAAALSEGDHAPGHSPWAELGRQVMAALPESYRTVLTLRVADGRSIRDVAEAMNTTPGNVKVLQHRALKRAAAVAAALEASGAPVRAPARR